jgi:UDP-N-acetylmuramyl pentapeptide synthase
VRAITADQFAEIVGGALTGTDVPSDLVIRHPAVHSDRLRNARAFFALRGSTADGHDFADRALANGASVAVVSDADISLAGPMVVVDDCLAALQRLAAWWRSQLSAQVVAVAGSNGKTITKDAIGEFLSPDKRVYVSPGSYNSQLGVPLSILSVQTMPRWRSSK